MIVGLADNLAQISAMCKHDLKFQSQNLRFLKNDLKQVSSTRCIDFDC